MSNSAQAQNVLQVFMSSLKRLLGYMATPMARIFGPRDDDYPATGVQPFEGDPGDKRHH
jgi:hypothetical protein